MGYQHVVWLDADAVIFRTDVNLASFSSGGIAMVRHPNPEHWNTGLMIIRASSDVEAFWRDVEALPDNESAWMEQLAVNELAAVPRFAALIHPLDIRFNSVPGFAMSDDPVIIAAHGLPHDERQAIIRNALAQHATDDHGGMCIRVTRREDFPEFLNRRGLTGEAAEIGVYRGEFSEHILTHWRGLKLHLVDAWRHLPQYVDIANHSDEAHLANMQIACRRLAKYSQRMHIHRALSTDAAQRFTDATLDFVYLDANHSFDAVWQDLHAWYPKIRLGGVLAGHDYLDGELPEGSFGVASAVNAFQQKYGLSVELTNDHPWRSWYLVKERQTS